MIYSLPSRFKGALLGCLIGESLNSNSRKINFCWQQSSSSLPLKIAIAGLKSIINCRELNVQSWLTNLASDKVDYLTLKNKASSSQTAIISLPVVLFYYEDLNKLRENLQLTINLWQDETLSQENVFLWGYLIQLILNHQLNPKQIIPKLILMMEKQKLSMGEILLQVDSYIQQQTSVEEVSNYLSRNCDPDLRAILQSIYCFASIPDDFCLGIQRTLISTYQPKLTLTLTAILLGLYNSYNYIPLHWRLLLKESELGKEIEVLSEHLFALWSGSYHLKMMESHQPCYSLGIIQTRDKEIKVKSRLN